MAVRPRTPGWSAARGSSLSGIEASEHACPVRPGTPGTGALCRRRSSTSRPRTGTRRSNRCRCCWRSFRPPHANGCTPRPHQRLRKSLPAARPGERRVPPHAAQEVAQAAREAAGVGPVAQQVAPVAREVSPAAPRRRFASLGSVVGSKSPPDPPGVLPGGYSGSVAWEEAPRTQTIRPQRAPPHRRQRPEPRHRPPHGSGGARLNVVPPGNQSMTSYSSGCIHFLSCFVSCTAHGQNATHFSVGAEASGPRKARVSNDAGGHIGSPQTVSGTVVCQEQPDRARPGRRSKLKNSSPLAQVAPGGMWPMSQEM